MTFAFWTVLGRDLRFPQTSARQFGKGTIEQGTKKVLSASPGSLPAFRFSCVVCWALCLSLGPTLDMFPTMLLSATDECESEWKAPSGAQIENLVDRCWGNAFGSSWLRHHGQECRRKVAKQLTVPAWQVHDDDQNVLDSFQDAGCP